MVSRTSLYFRNVAPRSFSARIIVLGALITTALILYTYSSSFSLNLPSYLRFPQRQRASCSPEAWSSGQWTYRPRSNLSQMADSSDALAFSGFEGCASSREFYWHLAADTPEQWDRFPNATSFDWTPENKCKVRPFNREDMVRDLVEQGGWLMLGEGHFFSLSCMLYPHVRATPNYTENPYFDRAWPQNLYLEPTSPLVSQLNLPNGFDIEKTPLVTFRRNDLLFGRTELVELYRSIHNPPENFSLFSEERFWDISPATYMPMFTAPLPEGNYATLVASTGGHWTTTVFHGLRNESRGADVGYGIENVIRFFGEAMEKWADDVQRALYEDQRSGNGGKKAPRQVVVRAYLPGHEDCHDWRQPWTEDLGFRWPWYNWAWIKDFNAVFQKTLSSAKHPDIHYLPIERPARLRPDAHATGDCLHIMAGAGVMEGWSQYIWHFVTRELAGRIR